MPCSRTGTLQYAWPASSEHPGIGIAFCAITAVYVSVVMM